MIRRLIILLSFLSCSLFQASDIFKAIESNNKKEIQKWLKGNPNIDQLNDQGQSVLVAAVQAGNKGLVKQLLKRNAAVNVVDKAGRTALDYAAELQHNKIVIKLIEDEAQVAIQANVIKVQKVLKRWARICLVLSLGLVVFAGLVIAAAIIVGAVLQFCCVLLPAIACCVVLFPLFIFAPSAMSECASLVAASAWYGNFCLGIGIVASLPFIVGSIYSAVSCSYWYRRANDVQILTIA